MLSCLRSQLSQRIVQLTLGGLLLSAAGLKLYGQSVSALPLVGWFATPGVQFVAVLWELGLGLALIVGRERAVLWLLSVGTFSVFAIISAYLGWQGVASCGCFGAIKASPWWTLTLDMSVLLILVFSRPLNVGHEMSGLLVRWRSWAPAAIAVPTVCLLMWKYDGLDYLQAVMRDEPLRVHPSVIAAGDVTAGNSVEYSFQVTNRTTRTIRLLGAPSTCRCLVAAGLPAEIAPRESHSLTVRVYFGEKPGLFDQQFQLYLEDSALFRVPCRVTARVQPRPAADAGVEP